MVPRHTPQPSALKARLVESAAFGAAAQDLTITTPTGDQITGITSVGPGAVTGCVLLVHGLSGSPVDAAPIGLLAQSAGLRVLALTARWSVGPNRDANGVPNTPKLLAKSLRGTITDAQWALDWLGAQPGCNPKHLGLIGVSFGGIMGAAMMRSDPRVTAPIFLVAGGDFRTIFSKTSTPTFSAWSAKDLDGAVRAFKGLDPADGVRNALTRTPILMVNGETDTVIVPESARRLHEAAGSRATVEWFAGGHMIDGIGQFLRVTTVLGAWYEQHGALIASEAN